MRTTGQVSRWNDKRYRSTVQSSRFPRALLGGAALLGAVALTAAGHLPMVLMAAYLALSALSFMLYWFDKASARRGSWRTAESTLHCVDALGGWPGALIAQQVFHHKTRKTSFVVVFVITVLVNLAAAAWLVRSSYLPMDFSGLVL